MTPDDELDPVDHIIAEVEADLDKESLALMKMLGELVRGMYLLAFAADEMKDIARAWADSDETVH